MKEILFEYERLGAENREDQNWYLLSVSEGLLRVLLSDISLVRGSTYNLI